MQQRSTSATVSIRLTKVAVHGFCGAMGFAHGLGFRGIIPNNGESHGEEDEQ